MGQPNVGCGIPLKTYAIKSEVTKKQYTYSFLLLPICRFFSTIRVPVPTPGISRFPLQKLLRLQFRDSGFLFRKVRLFAALLFIPEINTMLLGMGITW